MSWNGRTARILVWVALASIPSTVVLTLHLGEARWHANMVLHLGINRRSAVAYLRAMAERHPKKLAAHLRAAADTYEQVLAQLKTADTGEQAMMAAGGRETLAKLAERIAALEEQAGAELSQASSEMDATRDAGA